MGDIDIDEIIRAMQERSNGITYYLVINTGDIVAVDESIAHEVDKEYDEADTVIEEWGADTEDDDMYHEKFFSSTDEVDERELIKKIRFTNEDEYEPIPILTLKEIKRFVKQFVRLKIEDEELRSSVEYMIENASNNLEIEDHLTKHVGYKEEWEQFFEDRLRGTINTWIDALGLDIS